MNQDRPNPDQLLKQVTVEIKKVSQGKLTIFFGACAGVGKTYAMLQAAHQEIDENVDVVAGVIEGHGRLETIKLIEKLCVLPLKEVQYQGVTLKEFDLDAAIIRNPRIILIDELAHTNAPGSRHPKRWQDVEELLNCGINVFTTLNVQHLESLNDIVANFTGVRVKETIPDSIFDEADEIHLVDVPSELILERLDEGKVYLGDFAKRRAAQNFFKIENLIVLREIALRRTAERVDALRDVYKKYQSKDSRQIGDKILVCVGQNSVASKLIRTAKQMASKLKADWAAVYVENEQHYNLSKDEQFQIEKNLQLANQMGGESFVLQEVDPVEAILGFARDHGYTQILIGRSSKPKWRRKFFGSLTGRLIENSESIDVIVVNDSAERKQIKRSKLPIPWLTYLNASMILIFCTVLGFPFKEILEPENLVMLYMVSVVIVSIIYGRGPGIFSAVLSVLGYNFLFTLPILSLEVYRFQDIITLCIFLLTTLVISAQTSKLSVQNIYTKQRQKFTTDLFTLSQKLIAVHGKSKVMKVIAAHIQEYFQCATTIWTPNEVGVLVLASHPDQKPEVKEESVARWTFKHHQPAGIGTDTMPSARGYYLPLTDGTHVIGVLGIIPKDPAKQFNLEEEMMLEAIAIQATAALERVKHHQSDV
ncbi:MAG: DUF4118 domain-containing protein [Gammaproteobacteria bacterium]